MGTSEFDAIDVSGSGVGGVSMTSATGTTTLGDGDRNRPRPGDDRRQPAGVRAQQRRLGHRRRRRAGRRRATGGPAVDVTGTAGASLAFDEVSSTNSANDGVNIAGLGTGSFSAASGTIAGAAGIAFDLDGGSGAIDYAGTLGNGTGQAAEITSRTGGAVSLSGPIADNYDAGGGISVAEQHRRHDHVLRRDEGAQHRQRATRSR